MAYDEDLAAEIRALLAGQPGVTEQRMFGGLAFLVHGNLAVAVGTDDILVRVGRERVDDLAATTAAAPAVMGTRTMKDWMSVPTRALGSETLTEWVGRGTSYTAGLPSKQR